MTVNVRVSKYVFGALAAVIFAGCDENGKFAFSSADGAAEESASLLDVKSTGPAVERDVEAPDVFSVLESGLWDGRPSLGGVWVAHPDVSEPERVIIRNNLSGKSVIGALFRRERDNPGPALQVSSDAASELGLLAGAPSELSVIALRKEEVQQAIPQAVSNFDEPQDVAASVLEPLTDAGQAAVGLGGETTSGAVAGTNVAQTALDAIEAAKPNTISKPVKTSTAPRAASGLKRPFVQIGIFSVEANANRSAKALRADGVSTQVLSQESQGKKFWRVIVGPSPTAQDRAAVLTKVKALGFSDAYFVRN